ncbi:MAG: cysteine desulfurase [Firmicutes bacterium]|nr:cysteine desulfurase [Bacillota bacterium]
MGVGPLPPTLGPGSKRESPLPDVYLDNAATTRPHPAVIETVAETMERVYGNPSSPHGKGNEAARILKAARERVSALIDASPGEICFTSGGTESINTALKGVAHAYRNRGNHLVSTRIEHPATLRTLDQLAEDGFEITLLEVDGEGFIDPARLQESIRPTTILVSIVVANNEVGTVQPLGEIRQVLEKARHERARYERARHPGPARISAGSAGGRGSVAPPLLHLDAVQAAGKIPLRVRELGADLVSLSAHKINGPKGTGALYIREGIRIRPMMAGGGQEEGLRSGTENVPAAAGFGKAAELAAEWLPGAAGRLESCRARLVGRILAEIPGAILNGPSAGRVTLSGGAAPHIANLSLPGVPGEVMVRTLSEQGIFISTGSACSTRKPDPSHVLQAMGCSGERIKGALRFSFSPLTTMEEIDLAVDALAAAAAELRLLTGTPTLSKRGASS